MKRYKVAVITTHIAPAIGYGGPAVSIASLITAWGQQPNKILLCSSDASERSSLKPSDIIVGQNTEIHLYHSYWFKRWGFGFGAITTLISACWHAQTVYINGIATWPTTLAAIFCCALRCRFVIAARGGLMPEHLAFIRRYQRHKWWFYRLLTLPTLRCATIIHCTSLLEAKAIQPVLGKNSVTLIIPNGVNVKAIPPQDISTDKQTVLCYVGRIAREKGINRFIQLWLKYRNSPDRFFIAGSGAQNDPYYQEFQKIAAHSQGAIIYYGYLATTKLQQLILASHFLVLPSGLDGGGIRENFGNAVAEALSLSRPVIVTKGLAWDHLESIGAGLVFEPHEESIQTVIQHIQQMNEADRRKMAIAARQYAETHLDIQTLASTLWSIIIGKQN
ncbi:MAG: glycosyltransferase family 4 protein [Thioploca sp.]|nr:glycosyltransferase family 4 protein [Thioploca sp.]